MPKYKDLTGQRFGRLVAIEYVKSTESGDAIWLCNCDCGNQKEVKAHKLNTGYTKSCGCLHSETAKNTVNNVFVPRYCFDGTDITKIMRDVSKSNKSGHKGVWWNGKRMLWEAYISLGKAKIHLGRYESFEDAVKARKLAEEKYFKPIIEKYNEKGA